ncbi:PSP1 C-terminal domain-containing protein [Rubinisphaera italica]|uniref:PSP1 C-terminal domain-containing protein n=1 Tax=Rubinisphaera italica TaxID=2527969 RepID=A0A5C5XN37_9PLAN|nr:PSP1 C-terminal domain-containing protein [Rubinisphaera italica]TWT63891.1 hypothetical protein Pan54_46500 [Rubinisphaera italica]
MIDEVREPVLSQEYLVRFGRQSETVRCFGTEDAIPQRGDQVIVQTDRGERLATIMQKLPQPIFEESEANPQAILIRTASAEDMQREQELRQKADQEFGIWQERIDEWQVAVELVDLEWTHDGVRLLLYVLNDRGPECTKLALMTAAKGLGVVEVVPLSSNGIAAEKKSGGGCGSGGCGH